MSNAAQPSKHAPGIGYIPGAATPPVVLEMPTSELDGRCTCIWVGVSAHPNARSRLKYTTPACVRSFDHRVAFAAAREARR